MIYILTAFIKLAVFLVFSLNVRAGAEVISGAILAALHAHQVHSSVVKAYTKEIAANTTKGNTSTANGLKE